MLSKNRISFINSLKQKKQREIHRQFIAEGSRLVLDLLAGNYQISEIFATSSWLREHQHLLVQKCPCNEITEAEMNRITGLSTPSPVLALAACSPAKIDPLTAGEELVLILDEIHDPGNLGTIIRIADWFGIRQVVCSQNTVDLFNPKVVQSTMGSIARVNVDYENLPSFLSSIPLNSAVYGAFLQGENIYSMDIRETGVIVVGSESEGISPDVERYINHRIYIPSYNPSEESTGHAESLNAAVAAGIICSEFRRRKNP